MRTSISHGPAIRDEPKLFRVSKTIAGGFVSSKDSADTNVDTVGCAVLSSAGRIFTGINVFHFAGGPCAENVAFANAGAGGVSSVYSPGVLIKDVEENLVKETLIACVAVASDQRGVINPCGRCRQMMIDYYPRIRVIVKNVEGELFTVSTEELLPYAYVITTRPPIE